MKKYVMSVFILIGILFLTGCGSSNSDFELGENKDKTNSPVANQEIVKIVKGYDEGNDEAIVKFENDNKYYVIEDKILYSFEEKEGNEKYFKIRDKYLVVDKVSKDERVNYILNLKTGKKIYEGTDILEYVDITEDGQVLVKETKEELSGTTYIYKIIDENGKETWSDENNYYNVNMFKVIYENVVVYSDISYNTFKIIDAVSGKETDFGLTGHNSYFEYHVYDDEILMGISVNNDKYRIYDVSNNTMINTKLSHVRKLLDDKRVFAEPLWETPGIYNYENQKLLKGFDEGGIVHFAEYDDNYYIVSQTNFYYVIDDNYNYVKQPVKLPDNMTYNSVEFREFGMIIKKGSVSGTISYVTYEDILKQDNFLDKKKTVEGNLVGINNECGFLEKDGKYKLVDIKTLKEIKLSK